MRRGTQAILFGGAGFVLLAVVVVFLLIELPTHDTATWEAVNGRYLGQWHIATGEELRFPALVAGREDLRIEEVGASTGPGTHDRDVVVNWNGTPYRATAGWRPMGGRLPVSVIYVDQTSAPLASTGARFDGFSLSMLTLQFDGPIDAIESIHVDDPRCDELYVDFRAGTHSTIGLERDCVRYLRVSP